MQGLVDPVRHPHEGQFPQGDQVALTEVVAEGGVDLLGRVDVAVGHAPPEGLGAHVDELDLVGRAHDGVGDRLALGDARDALDHVVQ